MSPVTAAAPERGRPHDRVAVLDGVLRLDLRVEDPALVQAAADAQQGGQHLSDWVLAALRCGAAALRASGVGHETAALRAGLDQLQTQVDATVQTALGRVEHAVTTAVDPNRGGLAIAAQAAVDRLATGVGQLLLADGAVPAALRSSVTATLADARAEITRSIAANQAAVQQALSVDRAQLEQGLVAALAPHLATVHAQLSELRAAGEATRATGAERRRSTGHGVDYEKACWADLLTGIAHAAGDGGADQIGTLPGPSGSKKGDLLVTFTGTPARRLVVEAKAKALSLAEWRRELTAAKANRDAHVALGLCSKAELMPVPGQALVVLDEETIIAVWDPDHEDPDPQIVTAAYLLLRVAARLQHDPGNPHGVDLAEVSKRFAALRRKVEEAAKLDTAAASAARNAEHVRVGLASLRTELVAQISDIEAALAA